MSIIAIYRVSVEIPEPVFREFGHTQEYERKSIEATSGNVGAGQNSYSEVEEWADFHTRKDAEQCQKNLMNMTYYFAAKLTQANAEVKGEKT